MRESLDITNEETELKKKAGASFIELEERKRFLEEQLRQKNERIEEIKEEIEKISKKDKNINPLLKKTLLVALMKAIILTPSDKAQIKNEKNFENNEKKNKISVSVDQKIENDDKNYQMENLYKIPEKLEKPIEFLKNLDFIKGNFYILDKSDRKKPTLYEINKEGKIVSDTITGIGKDEGDENVGMTTPAGIYIFDNWIMPEDKKLYGENGVLRLLGYSINGETVDDIGVHIIYPPEIKERTTKMRDTASCKGISNRCINVFNKYFKEHILFNYNKQKSEKKMMFIAIMQEKNDFEEIKWNNIKNKIREDITLKKVE